MPNRPPDTVPVGYSALIERYNLEVIPHYRASYVAQRGGLRELQTGGVHQFVYPPSYMPQDNLGGQLEFALKYDGTNLEILKAVFETVDPDEIKALVEQKPNGKYARRIWYFYEFLTGGRLDLNDLSSGNYIGALDDDEYYTAEPIRVPRQRILDNLLGGPAFCPVVRRTKVLTRDEELRLNDRAMSLLRSYDQDTINRAVAYLYTKETLSSFLIEREKPSRDRAERFAAMLKRAPTVDELSHATIIEVRNLIVEERYRADTYRPDEVYVGESLSYYHQKVHFIGAPASVVQEIMEGLIYSYERMQNSGVHPVVIAAAISFGFVFIHPFDDGNGRTHRFLIHYILAKSGFTPDGIIFPVSSVIVNNLKEYDECLEGFSKPLMKLMDYELDEDGKLTIRKSPIDAYRYFDATHIAEYLFLCIQQTIAIDFKQELDFIVSYRSAKERIREIVDMPDRKIDLLIKFCLQNGGRLSKNKLQKEFSELSEEEIEALERAVKESIGSAAIAFEQRQ